jgi:AP-2 complex subunit mu-1
VIAAKETATRPPIELVDGCTFMHTRHGNLFFVACTRSNLNPSLVLQYLFQLVTIFKAYFGDKFDEDSIKNNFTLIYELLDETMDFGYPQNCAVDVLQLYINCGSARSALEQEKQPGALTSQITGAIDWRRDGIKYRKNEVFIDVMESVNLLMSANGSILRNDVTGHVQMKAYLSGMPECKFGLNDKLIMEGGGGDKGSKNKPGVEIDDCTFHRCVRLAKFDADRTITFIPPDGDFELMKYRITDNVNLPFRLVPAIQEEGKSRVMVHVKAIANFSATLFATNVVIRIPTPPNTAKARIMCPQGRAKYEPENQQIVWRCRRFPGGTEYMLTAEIDLITQTKDKQWSRPPIQLEFQVPQFTASGLHVRFLKVFEKSSYATTKWVRYITKNGSYQVRI